MTTTCFCVNGFSFFSLTLVFKALNGILGEGILIPWGNALFADILDWRGLRIYELYSLTHLIHAIIISISRLLYLYFHTRDRLSISWPGLLQCILCSSLLMHHLPMVKFIPPNPHHHQPPRRNQAHNPLPFPSSASSHEEL